MRLMSNIFLLLLAISNATPNKDIVKAFNRYMIVPTYLTSAPPQVVSVQFGDKVVNLGNKIDYYLTSFPPYISYDNDPNKLYSLVKVDLDLPCIYASYKSPYLHWLVVNIPGSNILAGDTITTWLPSTPLPGTGFHRYLYLVYKQTRRINTNCPGLLSLPSNLTNFSLMEFSKRYSLGTPIAGNFYRSQLFLCDDQTNLNSEVNKCVWKPT